MLTWRFYFLLLYLICGHLYIKQYIEDWAFTGHVNLALLFFIFIFLYLNIYTLNNIWSIVAFTCHVNLAFLGSLLYFIFELLYNKQCIEDCGIYWSYLLGYSGFDFIFHI